MSDAIPPQPPPRPTISHPPKGEEKAEAKAKRVVSELITQVGEGKSNAVTKSLDLLTKGLSDMKKSHSTMSHIDPPRTQLIDGLIKLENEGKIELSNDDPTFKEISEKMGEIYTAGENTGTVSKDGILKFDLLKFIDSTRGETAGIRQDHIKEKEAKAERPKESAPAETIRDDMQKSQLKIRPPSKGFLAKLFGKRG